MTHMRLIEPIAAAQHGIITSSQISQCNVSRAALRTLIARGSLERQARGIYRVAGANPSWRQRLAIGLACLGPAAVVSHRSAAALLELHRYRSSVVELSSPWPVARTHGRADLSFRIVHHSSRDLNDGVITTAAGLRTTTPARTLLDVARFVGAGQLGSMIDDAVRRKLTSFDELHDLADLSSKQGRLGTACLHKALESRPRSSAVVGSLHEAQVLAMIRSAGLPEPELQYRVTGDDGIDYPIDFAWPDLMLAVECEGFEFHHLPSDLEHDARRANELVRRNWYIHRITRTMFINDPDRVLADLKRVIALRMSDGRGAA